MAEQAGPRPLDGIRVVEMTTLGMGPLAGQLLGDFGADVIYCAAYGYAEGGPYAGRPAADDTIQAMSGLAALQQRATGARQFVPTVVADNR